MSYFTVMSNLYHIIYFMFYLYDDLDYEYFCIIIYKYLIFNLIF